MVHETLIDRKTDAILLQVTHLATDQCDIPTLAAVIRAILTDVALVAEEHGYQEGTANVEDIVAAAVREPTQAMADMAAREDGINLIRHHGTGKHTS